MTDEHGPDVPEILPIEEIKYDFGKPITPCDMLQHSAITFNQRTELYGDNYKKFGHVIAALNMDLQIKSVNDWNRLGLLTQIISKLMRYGENFSKGGHDDSLNDLCTYAAMLRSLDKEIEQVSF